MCSVRFLIIAIVAGGFLFGGFTTLTVTLLHSVQDEVEQDVAGLIDRYRNGESNQNSHQEIIPSFACECYDVETAKNISLNKKLNTYDLDFRTDVITVKYQTNKVHLIWGIKKGQKEGIVGPTYSFNYAKWDGDSCYRPSSVQTVPLVRSQLKRWTFMKSPYNLYLKDYELICQDCKLGVLNYLCED
jgi:hypothetical protein